jgi:hypothetical protein
MRTFLTVSVLALTSGCFGEAEWLIGDGQPNGESTEPTREIRLNQFEDFSAGLPAQPVVLSAAALDGVLFALVKDGAGKANLFQLPSRAAAWEGVALPTTGTERPTFITRIDFSLVVTAADSSGKGGLFGFSLGDDAWKKLSAPNYAGSFLLKRGSEWLWATTQGLQASNDRGATWTKRSASNVALFAQPVRRLVASPAATRLFAVGASGALSHSDDAGASWGQGLAKGDVTAMVALGPFVIAETANDSSARSDNYGGTFHPLSMGAKVLSFATLGNTKLVAATAGEVRTSEDGGATWTTMPVGLPTGSVLSSLSQAGSALLASTNGKLFVAQMEQLTKALSSH